MQRYFIKKEQIKKGVATIVGTDVHHITSVMRARVGDALLLCTCEKETFRVEIIDLDKAEIRAKITEKKEEKVELPVFVTIAQGITKGDKFDLVVQKGTECGASAFVPVAMKRCVAKIEANKAPKKVMRWQKIALEAARQAHRQSVPEIATPTDLHNLIKQASAYDVCLFAYEAFETKDQKNLAAIVAQLTPGARVLVLIGPEGGIDEKEVALLQAVGFVPIGLGPRILRTETAPLYVLAALSYGLEIERRI